MIALALAALLPAAQAGACCVGSTSSTPTALGECERWSVGVGLGAETRLGSWDSSGALADDSLEERALLSSVGAAWRWSRAGQLTAELPLRLTERAAGAGVEIGGGVGDTRLTVILDPLEEGALPVPVLRLGARLPSGRSWEESTSALQADVTGLVGGAVTGGVSLARTLGQVPWSAGASAEVPVGAPGAPSLLAVAGTLGRYLGTDWTVSASLRHVRTVAGWRELGYSTTRTTTGLQLIRGQRLAWRAWVGGGLDLPLPGLGRSSPIQLTASGGLILVR